MLPHSVRRVVLHAAPLTAAIIKGGITSSTTACRAAPAVTLDLAKRTTRHARRYSSSSSKSSDPSSPSNPPSNSSSSDNGPSDLSSSTGPSQTAQAATTKPSAAAAVDKRRRRRETTTETRALTALPSVPSTQHLPPESLALSSFFSMHRPISITHSLPQVVSDDEFASIFPRHTDGTADAEHVISTLSTAVQELEQPLTARDVAHHSRGQVGGSQPNRVNLRRPDGSDAGVYVQLNNMSGQFLPFCPPPIPEPQMATTTTTAASDATSTAAVSPLASLVVDPESSESQMVATSGAPRRVYQVVLTIQETADENGDAKFVARSSPLLEQRPGPRTFLQRMVWRQFLFDESSRQDGGEGMLAISVKRQRKLRMKKKKYKKLMKKTRNIRRKLDRT